MEIQRRETEIAKPYQELLERISRRFVEGQAQAVRSINEAIVETNWEIGKYIVEYEQGGNPKAKYGVKLLETLSHDLTLLHGRGFSRSNLTYMRLFYLRFPICETLSHKLSWSQYRMMIDNIPYRVDLVFYHRILRCFVLIDLKINNVKHNDIGQMNMYMGYFAKEENYEGDNPPIGIILSKEKNELLVEYATYGMSSQLFISKYQLYLPNKEELKRIISNQLEINIE